MKTTISLVVTFFLMLSAYSQTPLYLFQGYTGSDDELDPKKLHKWTPQKISSYNGVYHFGESEAEWDLLVIAGDSDLVLQSFSNEWGKVANSQGETWRKRIKVFHNVKIIGNKFESDSLTGFFMTYGTTKDHRLGIILPENPVKVDTAEFGDKEPYSLSKFWFFKGDYPELSYKVLDTGYFKGRSSEQLQVMRNTIYARYGQRFAKGGKMHAYFSEKKWYQPFRDNIQMCLTDIELRNIALIRYFERPGLMN